MDVRATTDAPAATGADTIAVGVFDDEGVAHDLPDGQLGALLESGEARTGFRKLALTHADGRRWIVAGLGKREDFDPERARIAAAGVLGRARAVGARSLCWELPHKLSDAHASAFVDGTVMGAYEFTMFKSGADEDDDSGELAELIVSAHHDVVRRRHARPASSASRSTWPAISRTARPTTSRRPRWPSAPPRSPTATTRSRSR